MVTRQGMGRALARSTGVWLGVAAILASGALNLASAQAVPAHYDHDIVLLGETLQPGRGADAQAQARLTAQAELAAAQGSTHLHVLVQLQAIPAAADRAALAQLGLELHHYVPNFAWIASLPIARLAEAQALPQVRWMGPWDGDRKQHPRLHAGDYGPWAIHPEENRVMLLVQLHADVALERGRELAQVHDAVAMPPIDGLHGLTIWIEPQRIVDLANEEEVLWIEEGPMPLTETNDGVLDATRAAIVHAAPYNLDGSGVRLFVFDGGTVRATHQNFDDAPGRVTTFGGAAVSSHATHVAGTAAGDGGTGGNARARGVAPAAAILSAGYSQSGGSMLFWDNAGNIQSSYNTARNTHNADLGTNSIGSNTANNGYPCDREGDYGVSSNLLDGIVRGDNPTVGSPVIMTWANGNERTGGTPRGRCGSNYLTTAPPSCAKNPIHIGASNSDFGTMTAFSSWGPCDDGRLKPTVTAPGCQLGRSPGGLGPSPPVQENSIFSSTSNTNTSYGGSCGTSMATPAVAGIVSLMIQQWRASGFGGPAARPLPALVKTLLVHTAHDRGEDGPDYIYGYGEVDAKAAVDAIRDGSALGGAGPLAWGTGSISHGGIQNFSFTVPPGSAEFKATLAWDDPASPAFSGGPLVNDLDLELIAPDATVHRAFVLNPASPHLPATRGTNTLDNQEQVLVESPMAGTWTVRVRGTVVPTGPQSFGLAYSTTPFAYDPGSCNELVQNGGFEVNTAGWALSGAARVTSPAIGAGSLGMGGTASTTHTAAQAIAIPADTTRAELRFAWHMTTDEGADGHGWDNFLAEVMNAAGTSILASLDLRSDGWTQGQWLQSGNMDLTPWAGQTITLRFSAINDVTLPTLFFIDEVSVSACAQPASTLPSTTTITGIVPPGSQTVGQPYTVNVSVTSSGTPTGSVIVDDGDGNDCSIVLPATSCALTSTSTGARTVTATYGGDATHNGSSDSTGYTITAASSTTTITGIVPPGSQTVGQPYTVNISVTGSGTPTGTVTVDDGDGNDCSIVLPATSCALTSTSTGARTVTATYGGDATHNGSSDTQAYEITPEPLLPTVTTIVEVQPSPSRVGQAVEVRVEVSADSAPTDGQVEVDGGAAGTCVDDTPTPLSATASEFACNLSFPSLGAHSITAHYSGSTTLDESTAPAVSHDTLRFVDVSVVADDGVTTTEPGASAAYLIEVRNAGPDQAVNVTLGTTSTPALEGPAWTCVGVDGGICPNPAGSGEIGETISLAAGAGLDYVLSGTVPDDVGPQQELTAGVLSDPSAPNFVHDTNAANDLSVDINVVEGIFADGFED